VSEMIPGVFLLLLLITTTCALNDKIESGEVRNGDGAISQLFGYINVNQKYNANLFYWMFLSQNNPATDPVVFWLTGGPGCSSELAIFFENGPWTVDKTTLQLIPNPYSWNMNTSVLYIDQPAGTGFSYANQYYIHNETQVGIEMYIFVQAFLMKYTQFKNNPFYVTGESYAGHYVPATAAKIIAENAIGKNPRINLQGVAIGDGLIDPVKTAKSWGPYAYYHGLISSYDLTQAQAGYQACQQDIDDGNYAQAFYDCNAVFSLVLEDAGNINPYDIRKQCVEQPLCYDLSQIGDYLAQTSVRQMLGIPTGVTWSSCNFAVYTPFESSDFEMSYRFDLPIILATTRLLIYNGNYDLIVDFYGQSDLLNTMKWPGQNGFVNAKNVTWNVDGQAAGSSRNYGNLTYVVVDNAGHMVPHDQGKNALDMINRFVHNKPFY